MLSARASAALCTPHSVCTGALLPIPCAHRSPSCHSKLGTCCSLSRSSCPQGCGRSPGRSLHAHQAEGQQARERQGRFHRVLRPRRDRGPLCRLTLSFLAAIRDAPPMLHRLHRAAAGSCINLKRCSLRQAECVLYEEGA